MVFSPSVARKMAQAAARRATVNSRVKNRLTNRKTSSITRKHNSGQQGYIDRVSKRGDPLRGGRTGIEQRSPTFYKPGTTSYTKSNRLPQNQQSRVTNRDLKNLAPKMAERHPVIWKRIKREHPSWSELQIMQYINKGGR